MARSANNAAGDSAARHPASLALTPAKQPAPRGVAVRRWISRHWHTLVVLATAALFLKISIQFELFELLTAFSRDHEEWEIDELFSTLMVASLALVVLVVLRARQLRVEIVARKLAEQRAQTLARHDPLTGLANRRVLAEYLTNARCNWRAEDRVELAVLVIDLDRFKPVNDIYGHAAGDVVLTEVADRIGRLLRGYPNAMVARIGGDEFACVVEHRIGSDVPIRLAKQMVDRLGEPIAIDSGNIVTIGASIGIAVCVEGRSDADELLRAADFAMYRAKRDGRSTFRSFEHSMQAEVVKRAALERELQTAIGNGQIVPHYQPITHLPSGELAGFEALARWYHPVHGTLPPTTFIPIAEDAGLIDELTIVLLRQACIDAKSWPPETTLSINLSPIQLKNRWLSAKLLQTVVEGGLAPARLTVEITESGLVGDFEAAQHIITSLKNAGVQVALDDFGTGFSTLSHLRQLNIDRIKIDRSFIHDITEPDTARMIRAIIGLGVNLGIAVTAEGIETEAGMDVLAEFGCDLGQGFLTGAPISAADVASKFFAENSAQPEMTPRARGSG